MHCNIGTDCVSARCEKHGCAGWNLRFAEEGTDIRQEHPRYVCVGDLDGESGPDFVGANDMGLNVRPTVNTGGGSYKALRDIKTTGLTMACAIADFDKDGIGDVALLSSMARSPIALYKGLPGGNFGEFPHLKINAIGEFANVYDVIAEDVNYD